MKTTTTGMIFLFLAISSIGTFANDKDKSSRPSPPATASCSFADGRTITIDYSSPRVKGREIYGALVPYDKVWRTGANEATTFAPSTDVNVGGQSVPAGAYTIFTLPNKVKWTLIVNKATGEWGIPYTYQGTELARADMTISDIPSKVENFTIGFDQKGDTCTLHMDWENTRASIDISEKK